MSASTVEQVLELQGFPAAIIDPTGCLEYTNTAFSTWLSCKPGDHIDRALADQPTLLEAARAALSGHSPGPAPARDAAHNVTYTINFKDLTPTPGGSSAVAVYAEQVQSDAESKRVDRLALLDRALDQISRIPYTCDEPKETLDRMVKTAVTSGVADSAVVYVNHDNRWYIRHAFGVMEDLIGSAITERQVRPSLKALRENRVIIINDVSVADNDTQRWMAQHGIHALMDAKIDVPWGDLVDLALHYHTPLKRRFSNDDKLFLERVASGITVALHNLGLVHQLRQDQRQLDLILDNMPSAVFMLDAALRVVRANKSFELLFGISAGEAQGKTIAEVMPRPLGARMQRHVRKTLEADGPLQFEEVLPQPAKSHLAFASSKAALKDDEGRPYGVVVLATDITERKRLEDEIRRTNVTLEARVAERTQQLSSTIAELERVTYTVAHDLRTPLRGIHRPIELLLDHEHPIQETEARDLLRNVARSAKRMDQLIVDLLRYSQIVLHRMDVQTLNIGQLVRDAIGALSTRIAECQAEVNVSGPFPPALGDAILVRQILANLLSNAIKFAPADRKPKVDIWATQHEHMLRLWVQDNGIGIDPRYRERVFQLFERLHAPGDYLGTGMGLAIAGRAAEKMEGAIGFAPNPAGGSRFWVDLKSAGDGA